MARGRGGLGRALAALACTTVLACGAPGPSRPGGSPHPTASGPQAPQPQPPSSPWNPAPPPPVEPGTPQRCAPTAGDERWVVEGDQVEATVRCSTGYSDQGLELAIEELPSGASFDVPTGRLTWKTTLGQAAVWNLVLVERTTGEKGTLKIGVVPRGTGLASFGDPGRYTEEYGLPVFHLFYDGQLSSGGYSPAQLVYRGRRYNIEAKYRGATSSTFVKRSFTLKFPDEDLFSEPVADGGQFQDRKRLVLISSFNDNSYVRPRLAFELWNRMSPAHVQIRTFSAVVYRNGRYYGVFTVADHVDKRLLARHGMSKDQLDLYKAVYGEANFSRTFGDGAPNPDLSAAWEKKEGLPEHGAPGWFDRMEALIGWVSDSSAADFRTGLPQRLNAADYEDWWIFNTLILGTDSQGKNSYHAWDPTTGGPWRYIPWDLDASLGQNYDTTRTAPADRNTFAQDNRIFARLLADPALAGPMRERYRRLLRNELELSKVQTLFDQLVTETQAAARRDWTNYQEHYRTFAREGNQGHGNFPKWGQRTDFTSYDEEVAYVRQWVTTRWKALEAQLP